MDFEPRGQRRPDSGDHTALPCLRIYTLRDMILLGIPRGRPTMLSVA